MAIAATGGIHPRNAAVKLGEDASRRGTSVARPTAYKRKRNFAVTREPAPRQARLKAEHSFVIQKHAASPPSIRKRAIGTAQQIPPRKGNEKAVVTGVELTHPDRVLYPEIGLTKLDLARYYEAVADLMLPHIAGRPLMVSRCPEGHTNPCFYQKHLHLSVPKHVRGVMIREKTKERLYLIVDDVQGLVSLAQMSVLEIHTWCSHEDALEKPDQMIFDLDPAPGLTWAAVVEGAQVIRSLLKEVGLECFIKVSGGKGLHVVAPIERRNSWEELVRFTGGVAAALTAAHPDRYIDTMSKAKRKGKIFVDYLRNQRGATCAAAYSLRGRAGAPASVPLSWDALNGIQNASSMSITNVSDWVPEAKRAWSAFFKVRQRLPAKLLGGKR